eukprot:TRINITY_DN7016_c0_g1_i1.p1 TRINITY_DN7016_c0_g1~~TRINITY_DN7016_c0_g1_i1.p1  ORF type:complete len:338 (-),score=66.56 TRINITY_DN7016_c0_g1_i1:298-1251(-)
MVLTLLYRSTFIDADDGSVVCMKPRSQSQPPCTRNSAAFADARLEETQLGDYVATLGRRAEQLYVLIRSNEKAKALLHKNEQERCIDLETASTVCSSSCLKNFDGQLRTTTSLSSASSTSLASSGTRSPGNLLKSFGGHRRTPSTLSSTSQAEPDVGEDTVGVPPTQGSVGHPEICRRPCIYFARGDCQNGAACGYCHLDHAGRVSHLDKRNRDMLKKMAFADVLSLVLKLAWKRAQDTGMMSKACGVLQVLENWSLTKPPAITVGTAEMKRLQWLLQNLPFSGLIILLLKKRSSDESQADADFAEQLQGALSQMSK